MADADLLKRCSEACGISGFEREVRELIRAELEGCCDEVRCAASGNVLCRKGSNGPRIALLAHMDEVGFMVQGITPDGFLLMVPIGGWWNHTLPSQRVVVHTRAGRRISGQVGTKPPHLLPESQRKQVLPNEALFVDVGASCEEDVLALGIQIGCSITPDVQMQQLAVPHRWMGKAFDNRAGVYCMIEVMRQLCAEPPAAELYAVGSVQEEVGTRGARALDVMPDVAIVLEGPPADDTYGQSGVCRQGVLGKGVQVRLYDPTHITPPALADMALELAATHQIPCQPTVRRTGGTDAAACYPNWQGHPALVLGVPTRYIHSHNGILDDRDLDACVSLCCALVRRLARDGVDAVLPG